MQSRLSRSPSFENGDAPSLMDVIERDPMISKRPGRLAWWYRLAAPPEPPPTANLKQREAYRRGRLTAIVSLMEIIINLILIPTVGFFVDHSVIVIGIAVVAILAFSCWLNRRGWTIAAGIIVVGTLELVFFEFVLNPTGGLLASYTLPFFDTLVLGVLFTVLLLPEGAVFIVALINILFIVGVILERPKTQELIDMLQTAHGSDAYVRPIIIQTVAALICYLWAYNSRKALERADRATTIAALEHSLAEQGQEIALQNQQLEWSIQQIVEAYTRVANGDLSARVPSPQDKSLWEVVGLLNNVLSRLQRLQQAETELQQVKQAVGSLAEAIRQSGGKPVSWPQTGTIFDTIVAQYNTLAQQYTGQAPGSSVRRITGWQGQ